jgi:secreted PhoX family phosphatase
MQTEGRISRRRLLQLTTRAAGALGVAVVADWWAPGLTHAATSPADDFGDLLPADANGLMLPPGFSSRIVATSGKTVGATKYLWHANPDGGAIFATPDSGWIYVSNKESAFGWGGASAIRFRADGSIVDAYSILRKTSRNCAGGSTPWNTWLSCEETEAGQVYECDPFKPGSQGRVIAGLGTFRHEAAAVDLIHKTVYLTEDQPNGLLYRFTPNRYPDLQTGILEAAEILDKDNLGPIAPGQKRALAWHRIANPNPAKGGGHDLSKLSVDQLATRFQAPGATVFNGGEGCWIRGSQVYFATKGDNRVWVLDSDRDRIEIVYDLATHDHPEQSEPTLSNVDNVFASKTGDVYVAEDPGRLQIVALTAAGNVRPVLRLTGRFFTELTGPAISPDGSRLYFSSQRNPGTTYEVQGPFSGASADTTGRG